MAYIPGRSRLGTIEQQVPGADVPVRSFGSTGEMLSKIGTTLANFGTELYEKRKRAEDSAYAFDTRMKNLADLQQKELELKQKYSQDPNGYTKEFREYAATLYDQGIQNAPSDDSRSMYGRDIGPYLMRAVTDADGYENTQKAFKWQKTLTDDFDLFSRNFVDNPNYLDAPIIIKDFETQIDTQTGILFTNEQAEKLKLGMREKGSNAVMSGLELQERYDEGIKLLESNHPSTMGLNADQKANWIESFRRGIKQRQVEGAQEVQRQVRDLSVRLLSPQGVSSQEVDGILASVKSNPAFDVNEQKRIEHELTVAKIAGSAMRKSFKAPGMDVEKARISAEKQIDGYTRKVGLGDTEAMQYKRQMDNMIQQVLTQRERDPVAYIQEYVPEKAKLIALTQHEDPNVAQKAAVDLLNYQTYLGVRNKQVFSDAQAYTHAQMIKQQSNAQGKAEMINNLQYKYGEAFPVIRDQLVKTKVLDDDIFAAAFVSDPVSKRLIVANAESSGALDAFRKEQPSYVKESLDTEVSNQMRTFRQSLIDSSIDNKGLSNAQLFESAVKKQALVNISKGQDIEQAVKAAKQEILDRNFIMAKGKNNQLAVPRVLSNNAQADQEAIEKFVYGYSFGANINKRFGVKVPESVRKQYSDKSEDEVKERWLEEVSRRGQWISNGSQTGAQLVIQNDQGGYSAVYDSEGKPIQMDYSDMQSIKEQSKIKIPMLGGF